MEKLTFCEARETDCERSAGDTLTDLAAGTERSQKDFSDEPAGAAFPNKNVTPAQLERIRYYEDLLNEATTLQQSKEPPSGAGDVLAKKIRELEEYYGSDEWKKDFSDDEAGLLPPDLQRGVLSEDGIYNLLTQYREEEQA